MRNGLYSLLNKQRIIICGSVRKFVTISIIFWTVFITLRYIVLHIGTACAPLVADFCGGCFLFVFVLLFFLFVLVFVFYERDFIYKSDSDVILCLQLTIAK